MATLLELQARANTGIDLRDQVPDIKVFPHEKVIDIEDIPIQKPHKPLSTLPALIKLTNAAHSKDIGQNGPSKAANATKGHEQTAELNLYDVFFPRDGHIVAYFLKDRFPKLTEATILETLRFTGVRENLRGIGHTDLQEPGRAPHEIRDGIQDPRAVELTQERDWGWPYYGAIDTTAKNIKAIAYVALHHNSNFLQSSYEGLDGSLHTVEEGLKSHINWIRKRMDMNNEKLVEMIWINQKHHPNESWADSPNAFHHADGSWAKHHSEKNLGVAPVEVQAEIYDALLDTVDVYNALLTTAKGQRKNYVEEEIHDLTCRAAKLKESILTNFWIDDPDHFGGFFARGTDRDDHGNLKPLAVRSSDMGHLLNSRILDGDDPEIIRKRNAVIQNLFSPEMLCQSGIRTLASDELLFRDGDYHNGTTWPWVSYYIALGLERHGYYGLSQELKERVWSFYNNTHLLLELGRGNNVKEKQVISKKVTVFDASLPFSKIHSIEKPPQLIQAWTAAAILAIKYEYGDRIFRAKSAKRVRAVQVEKRIFEEEILHPAA